MTSLPKLLSPLPEDLLQLVEEEMHSKDSIPDPAHMDNTENFGLSLDEPIIVKGDRLLLGGNKLKSVEGYGSSMECKGGVNKNSKNKNGVLSRTERGSDALTAEDLVAKTLKLPLLSSSYSLSDDSLKGVDGPCDTLKEASKGIVREKPFYDHAEKEVVEPKFTEVTGFVEKAKSGSGQKIVADKVDNSVDDVTVYTIKDNPHGDKICDSVIAEFKDRTALNHDDVDPPKKAYQRGSLGEQDSMTLPVVREYPIPGSKKKFKGSHGTVASDGEKQTLRVGNLPVAKTKKSSEGSSTSNNEIEDNRVQKDRGKARDTYRDFFGELEEDEDRLDSLETPYEDKLENSEVVEKNTSANICALKEKSCANKVVKPLTSDVYPKTATNLVRCISNGRSSDVNNGRGAPGTAPPVVLEDNWVQCDSCQKWRLLPVGTNPDSLPENWLCTMLDWL